MPALNQINVGTFCRELACGLAPLDELLERWELSEEQYRALRKNPWFQKEILAAVAEVKDLGPNSAFIMKCRGVADETLGCVLDVIENERVDPAVRIAAFKQITELGRLGPPKGEGGNGVSSGPSVVFNFGDSFPRTPETLTVTPDKECLPNEPTKLPQP